MKTKKKSHTAAITAAGILTILLILIIGTVWTNSMAKQDTDRTARAVSLFYLDELAGRREQVVEKNLQDKIREMRSAVGILTDEDLSDETHLKAFQSRIRTLYSLEKFAFVDDDGRIYTADGMQENISEYAFDPQTIAGPEISIYNLATPEKKVVIALPVDLMFGQAHFRVCFMQIDMQEMLSGISMASLNSKSTFSNIYTTEGVALSNTVLGGLAVEDNLITAMQQAVFEEGYSYEAFLSEFGAGKSGAVSFVYNGIPETLSYVPVEGTDWQLTYLIRESVISTKISSISDSLITRSVIQVLLTALVLIAMFSYIIWQNRRNTQLRLEREVSDAAARAKQEEMEERLELQERLLEEEKYRTEQDSMITAMASDYRSVYYVNLDTDDAVCYRSDPGNPVQFEEGEHFSYLSAFTDYAERFVAGPYRKGFLSFIDPERMRKGLKTERVIAYRYLVNREGDEYYEMIRAAGVRKPDEREDGMVHAVGLGLTVIDAEMRKTMDTQQALSDALAGAEQANRAKSAFLSSMSHEIRTPMNAIIGLDNIALNDPETPEKTKEYLKKIGASAEHLLSLINDILDMSRIESGRVTLRNEEFSFRKLLETVNTLISSQCQDKGLAYQCRFGSEVSDYYIGDSTKLRQVLINILSNAVKFTPAGGRIEMQIDRMASFDGKSTLRFRVADTGIGMSPEFLPHIFDAFAQEDVSATSKYGSSGLGMAITKNTVEMMNGNIEVESEKGKGSVFTVTVTLGESSKRESDEDVSEIRPGEMTVLVVDDDPVACEHAKLALGNAGMLAESASSGMEAIELVKVRHARRKPYDLILVDWKMPEMDGVETTRRIRAEIGKESAIIILTAYRWDDIADEALEAGVDSFISKPLFAGAVLEEFRAAVRRKGNTRGLQKEKADLEGRRILLAEDVEINAEIMLMILGTRGMQADLAENGRIAVDLFSKSEPGYYDAILMDMRMPEMDGLAATRAIRAMERADAGTIPIIALTANAFDEDVQRSLQAGLNAHLSKPVQPDALFETLEGLIQ